MGNAHGSPGDADASQLDPKVRFTSRVSDYAKHRPDYPPAVFQLLRDTAGLGKGSDVADVGSGTGIFSRRLLETGANVWAVEPNAAMRAAAERDLGGSPGFHSVDGSGEATTLRDASMDLVTCAQAFHWLAPATAAVEFRRILRPGGWVAVIWNDRRLSGDAFSEGYENLLRTHGTDYGAVARRTTDADGFTRLFGVPFRRHAFPNKQSLDLPGLLGRLGSASYVPMPGQPGHAEVVSAATELFKRTQVGGRVTIRYDLEVFLGRLI